MEFNATFIVTTISFIVFVLIMNAILYRPLEQIVEKREKLIEDNYNEARDADIKSKSLLEKKATIIAETKVKAKAFIATRLKDGYSKSNEVIKNAKNDSIALIAKRKEELTNLSNETEMNLQNEINSYACMVVEKLMAQVKEEEYHG